MTDATLPAELAGAVIGRRLTWFLDRLRDGAAALTDADMNAAWVTEPPAAPAAIRRGVCAHFASAIGAFSVLAYESRRADFALAVITLRPARPDDAAALRALERRCPITMGDVRVTYDRGEDYFAGTRLIGGVYPMVAERDGRFVAMHCMVTHELRVGRLLCGAVVGVWPAGLRILRESPGGREESVRALVIDTGSTPGAESERVVAHSAPASSGTRHEWIGRSGRSRAWSGPCARSPAARRSNAID